MKTFKWPILSFLSLMLMAFIFNFTVNAYIQLLVLYIFINSLMSMSLNLINGYTGQFSLGHAGFMAVGAYFSAYASKNIILFPESLNFLNFLIWSLGSGLCAALAGYLVGLPSLRLKGDYLAIVTLGFGEIIRVAVLNMDFLGGARGIAGITSFPEYQALKSFQHFTFFIDRFIIASSYCALWAVICFFVIRRLLQSSYGRTFLSVREDEIAAEAMGINTTQAKIRSFVMSSFFAGVAGHLFAHVTNYISPSSFSFLLSVNALIMVVLGGMGSLTGSIVAAIFITLFPEILRPLQELTGVDLRMIIYSLSLIVIMILRPQGLFGNLELTDVWRKYATRK